MGGEKIRGLRRNSIRSLFWGKKKFKRRIRQKEGRERKGAEGPSKKRKNQGGSSRESNGRYHGRKDCFRGNKVLVNGQRESQGA